MKLVCNKQLLTVNKFLVLNEIYSINQPGYNESIWLVTNYLLQSSLLVRKKTGKYWGQIRDSNLIINTFILKS